jgi:hypothetical protein
MLDASKQIRVDSRQISPAGTGKQVINYTDSRRENRDSGGCGEAVEPAGLPPEVAGRPLDALSAEP